VKERLAGLWCKYRSLRSLWQVLIGVGIFIVVLATASAGLPE